MKFKPESANSAGLITNYKCTFKCKHCLYCSSPDITDDIGEDLLKHIIDEISGELKDIYLHIGGGEPLIYFDRLKNIISYIKKKSVYLEYVETNGFLLLKNTEEKLKELKNSGLNRLLLSISPFHNEFISLEDIKKVFKSIVNILGSNGIFPWHSDYFYFLEKISPHKPVNLEEYFNGFSLPEILYQLTSIIYIHPTGRAGYLFSKFMELYPPEELFDIDCAENLSSPVHAHIDYNGNYITGFCSGLRIGERTAMELGKLYEEGIDLEEYKILEILIKNGLRELYKFSLKEGYIPNKKGYVSSCHLCLDIRSYLYSSGKKYKELYPSFLYEELNSKK